MSRIIGNPFMEDLEQQIADLSSSGQITVDGSRYFDVEIREIPMEDERLLLTPEEVLKRCDENIIGVVVTLGVTFTLQFEPVHEISVALDKLQTETGLDIPIHVDGAGGAFLAPFLQLELL